MIKNKFRMIIPAYNCERWINRCLWSVIHQDYLQDEYNENYSAVLINDRSTDHTLDVVYRTMQECGDHKFNFRFFNRIKNVGALENIIYGIDTICFDDEDIIILLDGDDSLFSYDVVSHLNNVYQDPNVLLTYGQYINESHKRPGNNKPLTVSTRDYRSIFSGPMYWCTSHLRTFKYKIWKRIQDVDFRDWRGNYFSVSWDMAIMYPLIEMAGNHRIRYIDKIMYLYNDLNPINDFKKDIRLQEYTANYIKHKLKYRMLSDNEL